MCFPDMPNFILHSVHNDYWYIMHCIISCTTAMALLLIIIGGHYAAYYYNQNMLQLGSSIAIVGGISLFT
jgi:hypothetical protein